MGIDKKEYIDAKMKDIKELKRMKEEFEDEIKAVENEIIAFLLENEECAGTNKKGDEIRQYRGTVFKATYSSQTKESLDKEIVREMLTDDQYNEATKSTTYNVLRVS